MVYNLNKKSQTRTLFFIFVFASLFGLALAIDSINETNIPGNFLDNLSFNLNESNLTIGNLTNFTSPDFNQSQDNQTAINISLPENNQTFENQTELNTTIPVLNITANETIESNLTDINESVTNGTIQNQTEINFTSLTNFTSFSATPPTIDFTGQTPLNGTKLQTNNFIVNVSTVSSNGDHYVLTDLDNSLVGWWRLNNNSLIGENSSYVVDETGRNNGTVYNNSIIDPGIYLNGRTFNGIDNYISFSNPSNFLFKDNFSVSGWVYPQGDGGRAIAKDLVGACCDAGGYQGFYISATPNAIAFKMEPNSTGMDGITIQSYSAGAYSNKWTHVTAVKSDRLYLYINGELATNSSILPANFTMGSGSNYPFALGASVYFSRAGFFNGSVDEVIVLNRSLSDLEIKSLYNATSNQYYNNFTNLSDRTHSVKSYTVDSVGNLNQTPQVMITTSAVYPTINLISPNQGSFVNTFSPTINFSVSHPISQTYSFFDDGLVGWWRLNNNSAIGENKTLVVDESGNGFNGTCTISTCPNATLDGSFGGGMYFSRSNDYILLNTTSRWINGNSSVSVWIKPLGKGIGGGDYLSPYYFGNSSISNQYALRQDGTILFYTPGDNWVTNDGAFNIFDGGWHHLVMDYDGSTKRIYIDGNLTQSRAIVLNYTLLTGTLIHQISGGYRYNGTLDEFMLFNRSLSYPEVKSLYNSSQYGLQRNSTLTGLDQNLSVTAVDITGKINTSSISFLIDTTNPSILFTGQTPYNQSKLSRREIIVNMSSAASNRTHYVLADFDNSLIGWWRMDNDLSIGENSTKIYDWSGRNYNLTARGNITPTDNGIFDGAYQFEGDGNDFLANLNMPSYINPNISVGGWFYNRDSSEEYYLCLHGTGSNTLVSYFCLLKRGGVGTLWTWNNSGIEYRSNSTGTLAINQWNHVFLTYENKSNVKIYVNGKLSYDLPSKGLPIAFNKIYLGSYVEGSGQTGSYLNGSMDEVILFNRTLSQIEIFSIYNASASQYYNNFSNLNDGNHTIVGYAVDSFGNLNQTQFSSTTNTPFLNLISPPIDSILQTQSAVINFSVSKFSPNRTYSFFNDGLVGWWRLENSSQLGENGTLFVNEAKGSNGTCLGTACPRWNSSGYFGSGYTFDGINDEINITNSNSLNITGDGNTISFWVYKTSLGYQGGSIIKKGGGGFSRGIDTYDEKLWLTSSYGTYASVRLSPTNNRWEHHVFVFNQTNSPYIKHYINGNFDNTGYSESPGSIGSIQNNYPIVLGFSFAGGVSRRLNGTLDELMIFNRSLSESEIKSLFNSTQYNLSRPISLTEGNYIINSTVVDNAGTINTNFSSFEINLPPAITLNSPIDSVLKNWSQNFDCSASDNVGLSNITLYIWNETDEIYKNTKPLSGLSDSANWDFVFDHNGNYIWNCQAFDSLLNAEGWATNQTLIMDNIFITLSWLNQSNDLLYFHYNNSLMLNLSCDSGECSDVNVSLYRFSDKNLDSGSYINHDSGSCGGTSWNSRGRGLDAICDLNVLLDTNYETFYGLRSIEENYIGFYFSEPKEVQIATSYWTGGTNYLGAGFNFEYYNDSDGTWIAPSEWNYTADPYNTNTEIYLNLSQPVFTSAVRLHKPYYSFGSSVGLAEVRILGKSIISEIESTSPLYMNETNVRIFSLSAGQSAEMNFNVIPEVQSGTENIIAVTSRINGRSEISETKSFTYDYDSTPPSISFTNNPFDIDTIDPDTSIFFNATVSDSQLGVRDAVLEYYNGSRWQNLSMAENISNLRYQANFTTLPFDTNYTIRVRARDMFGNTATTTNRTISSEWDCNWTLSTFNFGALPGFDETKPSLNLTIFNIGDVPAAYNCSLRFRLSYNLPQDRIYFDGDSLKPSNSYNIEAKQNQTVLVSAVFLSENIDELLVISADEVLRRSVTRALNSSGRLISTTGGPYLFEEIKSAKVLSLNLSATNFSIEGTLKNIVGDGSDNNTAYNVNFNWTFPEEFGINPLNSTLFYENLSESNIKTNRYNVSLNRTNLVNLAPKSYDVYLYSSGYSNMTGALEIINHAGNETILSEKIVISFTCVSASDGIYVPACGQLDGDYVAPTLGGNGGSGGASGAKSATSLRSQATFELVRGKDNSFQLEIKNPDETSPLTNLTVKVSGINSQYIIITPSVINEISPLSSKNITIKINAPSYFSQGNYTLFFDIEGFVLGQSGTKVSYSERKVTTLFILDIDRTNAINLVDQIILFRNELNQSGLNDKELVKLISSANRSLNSLDFVSLQDSYKQAKLIHDSALEAKKILEELRNDMNDSLRRGLTVIETEKMVFLAQTALARGDYSLALERLREAKLTYALEVKGEFNLVRTITNNPLESTGIALGAIAFTTFTTVAIRLRLLKRKRRYLEDEEKLLLQLMKVVQIECFEKKSLSMEEYDESMRQYENRLSEAIAEKIKVDTKIANILKIRGKNIALAQERAKIIELIKKAQDDYMNKGTLETRVYENMLKTYSGRLAEVEEQLAFFDVQRAIKSQKGRMN